MAKGALPTALENSLQDQNPWSIKLCGVHRAARMGAWPLRMRWRFRRVWGRVHMCSPPAMNDTNNPPSPVSSSVRMGWGGPPRSTPVSVRKSKAPSHKDTHMGGDGVPLHEGKMSRLAAIIWSLTFSPTASHMLLVYSGCGCISFSGPSFLPQDICTGRLL